MKGFSIIIILLICWLLYPLFRRYLLPRIKDYLMRQAIRKFARSAGFDIPPKEKNRRREAPGTSGRRKTPPPYSSSEPLIPKEYAEDVEYTEIRSYSEEIDIDTPPDKIKVENQVSDAEIIEIKKG